MRSGTRSLTPAVSPKPARHWHGRCNGRRTPRRNSLRYADAIRLYDQALAKYPDEAQKRALATSGPWTTAQACLLVAQGKGHDAPPAAERGVYRAKGLVEARRYLANHVQLFENNPEGYRRILQHDVRKPLYHRDFAAVRPPALDSLAEPERCEWQSFWTEVQRSLARTDAPLEKPRAMPLPR
jgi:hypothetical protein